MKNEYCNEHTEVIRNITKNSTEIYNLNARVSNLEKMYFKLLLITLTGSGLGAGIINLFMKGL